MVYGAVFAIAALTLVGFTLIRYRLRRSSKWVTLQCPRCRSSLAKVHRHFLERLLSVLVPVQRFKCTNSSRCTWKGLRVQRWQRWRF